MKQLREKIEELLCNSKCTKEEISFANCKCKLDTCTVELS